MLKNISVGVLALAIAGFSGSAMAACTTQTWNGVAGSQQIDAQNYCVNVNIVVEPEVSLWAAPSATLTMSGADGNNSATALSSISVIGNVPAAISATVAGTLPDPAPGSSNGGISFFIFPQESSTSNAVAAITLNAYNPVGAVVWDENNMGVTQPLFTTGTHQVATNFPVVYASSAPGDIPLPATYPLTVTYTIAQN